MIIGIAGYARSGKDTVADILVQEHGFTKIAFADKLREVLYALNPLVRSFEPGFGATYERIQDVIDKQGWDGYKNYQYADSIREYLQRLGTEAGRQILGENIWVDALNWHVAKDIVIPDMRFPNEALAVESRGGYTWRVLRPGVTAVNAHSSETALDDFPFHLYLSNDSTIESLSVSIQENLTTLNFIERNSHRGKI